MARYYICRRESCSLVVVAKEFSDAQLPDSCPQPCEDARGHDFEQVAAYIECPDEVKRDMETITQDETERVISILKRTDPQELFEYGLLYEKLGRFWSIVNEAVGRDVMSCEAYAFLRMTHAVMVDTVNNPMGAMAMKMLIEMRAARDAVENEEIPPDIASLFGPPQKDVPPWN